MNNKILTVACLLCATIALSAQEIQPSKWVKGDPAPAFTAEDTLGNPHSLSDWTGLNPAHTTGQPVVVDFWASWCGDCRREFPDIKALHAEFGQRAVFVGLSMDHDAEAWRKCLRQQQFPWLQISNLQRWKENAIALAYDLHWIPTYFVVDAEGLVLGSYTNAGDLRTALETLFADE